MYILWGFLAGHFKTTFLQYSFGWLVNGYFFDRGAKSYTQEMRVSNVWRLAFKLSIRFRSNWDETKFLTIVENDPSNYGIEEATGPVSTKVFTGFEAGYRWTDNQKLQIDPQDNQLKVKGGQLLNKGVIEDIAAAEFQSLYFNYRNRIVGSFKAAGWVPREPVSQTRAVGIQVSGGAIETTLNASQPPPAPSVWEHYDPVTKAFVGRLVESVVTE